MGEQVRHRQSQSLSTLSLDVAIQLDLIRNDRSPDLVVICEFLQKLRAYDDEGGDGGQFCLTGDPLSVETFNSALHRVESAPIEDIGQVQRLATEFYESMKKVSEGKAVSNISSLRDTCLALHQAILSEKSPFRSEDDWVFLGDDYQL